MDQYHSLRQSFSKSNGKIKISILIYGHLRKNDVQMNLSILHIKCALVYLNPKSSASELGERFHD